MDSWDGAELAMWFKDKFDADSQEVFNKEKANELISFAERASKVDVSEFIRKIKAGEIVGIGLNQPQRQFIKNGIDSQDRNMDSKTYSDGVHCTVHLAGYIMVIIKQPEFYRLKDIKQLGCTDYVYSTAIGKYLLLL